MVVDASPLEFGPHPPVDCVAAHPVSASPTADEEPLRSFYERRVFDTDIDLLFHAGLDGLEDPELHAHTSPPVNLEFDRWFMPFRGCWPPAPVPDDLGD